MMQIDKILVPTDFSDNAKAAIQHGCELSRQFGAELHLLHVVSDSIGVYSVEMEMVGASSFAYNVVEAEKQAVQQLAELPGEVGRDCRIVRATEVGIPGIDVTRYAKEKNIDLIVVSTHGYTGLAHFLMGSIAESIVRHAPCPVLTVRPDGHPLTANQDKTRATTK